MCAVVFAPGLACPSARGAVQAGALRVESPATDKVLVEFGRDPESTGQDSAKNACMRPPKHTPTWTGRFTLLLRNTGSTPLRPRLTLDPATAGAPVLYLHLRPTAGKSPVRLYSTHRVPTLDPDGRGVGRLALAVSLPATCDPDEVDGTLVIHAVNSSMTPVGQAVALPITATEIRLRGVQPVPHAVTLHTTAWLPGWLPLSLASSDTATELELRGPGAQAFEHADSREDRALLRASDGRTIVARLVIVRHQGNEQPTLELTGHVEAGTYTGVVPISVTSRTPTLSVTVTVRDCFLWPFLMAGLGVILGGLLPLLGKRAHRRDFLRARLQGILIEYFALARRYNGMEWLGLNERIGTDPAPWTSTVWLPAPELEGAAGLFSQLHWAQSEGELEKLEQEIDALRSLIVAWMKLAPKVTKLQTLAAESTPELLLAIGDSRWESTQTQRESERLWKKSASAYPGDPPSVDSATATAPWIAAIEAWRSQMSEHIDQEARQIDMQIEWHGKVAGVWEQLAKAWSQWNQPQREENKNLPTRLAAIAQLRGPTDPKEDPTKLEEELGVLLKDLQMVAPGGLDATAALTDYAKLLPAQWTTRPLRNATGSLRALWQWVKDGLQWFATSATLRLRRFFIRSKPARLMAAAKRQDLALSLIAVLGAVLVYALKIYTPTWGAPTDYLSAIAAGFSAQVVVRWVALPTFEAWRPQPQAAT
jgi:hypothetical protein